MTTSTTVIDLSSFTTDAKFRTWGAAINAALTAAGLTNTADTGQINWTTVTKPIATATQAGYEIWRFNDTLQSTKPIFIRIGYGSGGVASGNSPATWITVGTGSDGAGTITGVNTGLIAGAQTSSAPTNTSATIQVCYNATSGYLLIAAAPILLAPTYYSAFWCLTRTSDSSGAATGTGFALFKETTSNAVTVTAQYVNFSSAYVGASTNPRCGMLQSSTSAATGSTVPLYKHYAGLPDFYPINTVVTYFSTDMVDLSTFSASPFGGPHTYIAIGSKATGIDNSAAANAYGAFLWE